MAVSHAKSVTFGDFTGTVTAFNSQGSTTTVAATDLARPVDWNSVHNQFMTLGGNTITLYQTSGSGSDIRFHGSGGISIGFTNTSQYVVSGPLGPATFTRYNEFKEAVLVAGQFGNGSMHIQGWNIPNLHMDRIVMPVLFTGATNSTGSYTISYGAVFYTRNVSTLSSLHSSSWTTGVTHSGTANSTLNSGMRIVSFPWTTTITEGNYFIGLWSRTTSGGANATISNFVVSQINSNFSGFLGSTTAASNGISMGFGVWSTTSTLPPASVPLTAIFGSASVAMRPPALYFVSGSV